jgi:hypothetical protein
VRTLAALLFVMLGVAFAMPAFAQRSPRALAGSVPRGELPAPLLTLRPSPELLALAVEAAEVLELRTGQRVEIGDPPPPGLMEAVPAGHVALAVDANGTIVIVLGAAGGLSHDTVVRLGGQSGEHVDARAVALAVEALRDLAMESSLSAPVAASAGDDRAGDDGAAPADGAAPVAGATQPSASEPSSVAAQPEAGEQAVPGVLRDEPGNGHRETAGFLGEVEPFAYVRAYSGASAASPGPRMGVGTGLGLCVMRQCLVVFGEVPVTIGAGDPVDTRYQYTTFGSGFYSRPFQWGSFTPGASLGFVTRLGYFEQDMGLPGRSLQTDLGARATLELGYELVTGLDVLAETGADLILDRLRVHSGDQEIARGERLTPWMQGSLRYRL